MQGTAQACVADQVAKGMKGFNEVLQPAVQLSRVHILFRAGGARGLYIHPDKVVAVYFSRKKANAEARRLNQSKHSRSLYFVVGKTVEI